MGVGSDAKQGCLNSNYYFTTSFTQCSTLIKSLVCALETSPSHRDHELGCQVYHFPVCVVSCRVSIFSVLTEEWYIIFRYRLVIDRV